MGLWDGNLSNSPGNIILDSAISLAIALAYYSQIIRLWITSSTDGLSPLFILFNTLFSNHQLAHALLLTARAWPDERNPVLERIARGQLHGTQAVGAVLGIVQVALQWAGSVAVLMVFVAKTTQSSRRAAYLMSSTSISIIAFVHAALVLFPAVAIALPKPSPSDWDVDIFTGLSAIFGIWFALLFVVIELYPQIIEFRQIEGSPGSLSLVSLGLRLAVMVVVAVRWFLRLGTPTWRPQSAPLTMWYQWGSIPINYCIDSLVCAVLLVMYLRADRSHGTGGRLLKQTPLLAP